MRGIRDETFDGTFPFAPRYLDLDCFAMHYVDEGNGDPVVLVHGYNATEEAWSPAFTKALNAARLHR